MRTYSTFLTVKAEDGSEPPLDAKSDMDTLTLWRVFDGTITSWKDSHSFLALNMPTLAGLPEGAGMSCMIL